MIKVKFTTELGLLIVLLSYSLSAQNKFSIGVNDLKIDFEKTKGNQLKERLLLPIDYDGNTNLDNYSVHSDLSVSFHVTGENRASHHGAKLSGGNPGLRLDFKSIEEEIMPWGKKYIINQEDKILNLKVVSYYEFYNGTNTCRRYTTVVNLSNKKVGINHLSSAMINNIGNLGQGSMEEKLLIHWASNSWKSEGQWHKETPSEAGWGENGRFQLSGIFHSNFGSQSTVKELPMAMVENKAVGLTWFWQIEHGGSWHWEFSDVQGTGKDPIKQNSPTYVYIGGPDENNHHAYKELAPGEIYESVPVAIGCVKGGFGDAVEALTKYRRVACLKPHKDNKQCPVIFNDYMNCLSGKPTTEKELPLIEAASDAGCDYFVIDAGWYSEIKERWWTTVGMWRPGKSRFPGGLNEVLDRIREENMIPGLWLEIERAGVNSPLKDKPDEWFFMRHGKRTIDNDSYMLDFRNKATISHVSEVVDRVINEYGAGYIKMDYNVNSTGTDTDASSMGQGLLEHHRAYKEWMKSIYSKSPDLVIENCGSGGMRMDYSMLSMNQVQSSSDQTNYKKYPSILVGTMAAVLPEQLAIWSYPLRNGDKYEASFNMVNSMLGRIHQSGHLAELPKESFLQVKKGIEVYKKELAKKIPEAIPFFPLGMPKISDNITPVALGLEHEQYDYYALWRLSGNEVISLRLKNKGKTEILYPKDLGIELKEGDGVITVKFPEHYMGVILKVSK